MDTLPSPQNVIGRSVNLTIGSYSEPRSRPDNIPPLPIALSSRSFGTPHFPHIQVRDPQPSSLHRVQWLPLRSGILSSILRRTNRPPRALHRAASRSMLPLRHPRSVSFSTPPPGPCRLFHPPFPPKYMHFLTPSSTHQPHLPHALFLPSAFFWIFRLYSLPSGSAEATPHPCIPVQPPRPATHRIGTTIHRHLSVSSAG